MSSDEARRLVKDGLQLHRERREAAKQEARMEEYEKTMIAACNENCACARKSRQEDEERSLCLALEAAQRKEQQAKLAAIRKKEREQLQREWARDASAYEAVRQYVFFCMGVMLVTVWTPFPWWAAAALIFGTAVCLGAYIFRLYFPIKEGAYAKD